MIIATIDLSGNLIRHIGVTNGEVTSGHPDEEEDLGSWITNIGLAGARSGSCASLVVCQNMFNLAEDHCLDLSLVY